MYNELDFCRSGRHASIVKLKGFEGGTLPEDVADLLWSSIGINVDPKHISVAPHDRSPFVTVIVDRECLADFLGRALAQAGKQITAEPSNFGSRSRGRQSERDGLRVFGDDRIH